MLEAEPGDAAAREVSAAPERLSQPFRRELLFACDWLGHRTRVLFVGPGFGLLRLPRAQVLAEDPVPRRDDDGDRAGDLRLAGESDERLRLVRLDVAELLDAPAFEACHVGEFLRAAEHADPARPARGRAALDRNRPLYPARVDRAPFARVVFG